MKLYVLNCCGGEAWKQAAAREGIERIPLKTAEVQTEEGRERTLRLLAEEARAERVVCLFANYSMEEGLEDFVCGLPQAVAAVPVGADAMLMSRGNVPPSAIGQVNTYITYGGDANILGLMQYLRAAVFEDPAAPEPPPPMELPFDGIYDPGSDRVFQSAGDFLRAQERHYDTYVGMLSHRSYWLDHALQTETAIVRALDKVGVGVIPVFASGEKSQLVQSLELPELVERFFSLDGQLLIQGLVNFQMHLIKGQGGMSIAETSAMLFQKLGLPVFHPIASYYVDRETWETSDNPLAGELQMDYLTPEMAGMIEPMLVALRSPDHRSYVPLLPNVEAFARRVKKWTQLRTKPNGEKKLALMLHNDVCAGVEATIGKAFGLDAFESTVQLMERLKEEGYQIEHIPENGEALRRQIMERKAFSDFRWTTVEDILDAGGCLYRMPTEPEYQSYFRELSPEMQERMVETWGPPPGEGMVMDGDLIVTGISFGALTVLVQPKRGCYGAKCTGEVCRILHDPTCPPTHQYLATYRYLERVREVDAIIHMGTDGSLEYLPGKASGLGQGCWPYAVLGAVPDLYPYHLGVTSEGTIAKRRANAVLLGHYPPSASGLHGDSLVLMDKLNAYEEAARLENGQEETLKGDILGLLAEKPSLLRLLNSGDSFGEGVQLVRSALLRCAEGQKLSRLHVFGEDPDEEEAISYVCEVLRGDGLFPRAPEEDAFAYDRRIRDTVERAIRDEEGADPLTRDIQELCRRLGETHRELDRLVQTLSGQFLPPSEGGMPDENGRNILPTGRNFHGMNGDKVPTETAYDRGVILAEQLLGAYLKDEGAYPKKIAMNMISLDIARTHGEQLSEFLYLLGVRPCWDRLGRVIGLEPIPLDELKRPRIDVTVRISGVMRDTWPDAVGLMDEAVLLASALEEAPEDNYVLANIHQMEQECGQMEERDRTIRIFGDPPGAFGAGIDLALKASAWETDKDLARYFIQSSAFAYGKDLHGRRSIREFIHNAKSIDLSCDVSSSGRADTLGCGFGLQVHGGFKVLADTIGNKKIRQYQSVTDPGAEVRTDSLARRVEEDMGQTLLNEAWQESMMDRGYLGAAEMMRRIQTVFDAKCTGDAVTDEAVDRLTETYMNDKAMRQWLLDNDPYAAEEIGRRLLELERRGKWRPSEEILRKLQKGYLAIEGTLEGGISGNGELQGGNVEIVRDDQVALWKDKLRDVDTYLKELERR